MADDFPTINKGGRPRKELTDEQFDQLIEMVKIQCTQVEICNILKMNHETLDRILKERGEGGFSQFFKRYGDGGKSSLRRKQWLAAMDGNPTMLVWLGKQMLGQKDKTETTNTHRWEGMTDDELNDALEQRLAASFEVGKGRTARTH